MPLLLNNDIVELLHISDTLNKIGQADQIKIP